MIPTIPYLRKKFTEFNEMIFGGRLPDIPIELSDVKGFLGQFVSRIRPRADGSVEHFDYRLKVNTRVDFPENVIEDILIHEMIHYFIHYNELRDTSPHGEIFKAMMVTINAAYGRNITVSQQLNFEQRTQLRTQKPQWRVIAVIHMSGLPQGMVFFKVLPRVAPRIIDFCTTVRKGSRCREIELYLHDSPFFNDYPRSVALRLHRIELDSINRALRGARRLEIRGASVVEVSG